MGQRERERVGESEIQMRERMWGETYERESVCKRERERQTHTHRERERRRDRQ